MHEKAPATTINGHEISSTREKLSPNEFREMLSIYGLDGNNPEERVEALKGMSAEKIAMLLTDINRRVQGSEETLMSEKTMKIGEKSLVAPEFRYGLFMSLFNKIAKSPNDTNPARIGDALALGIVLLHPFADGNGRTSRLMRLAFDSDYDADDYEESFNTLAESRDVSRARGGSIILGYVPRFNDSENQSDPSVIEDYFDRLLKEDNDRLYTGPYGYSGLKSDSLANV